MDSPLEANLLWAARRVEDEPGWAVLETPALQAIRTPVPAPVLNLAWGLPSPESLARARTFFGDRQHRWYLPADADPGPLAGAGYVRVEATREMVLDLAGAAVPPPPAGARVAEAGPEDLAAWSALTGEIFGAGAAAEAAVWRPLLRRVGSVAYLVWMDGAPVATALVTPGEGTGGVHNVATLPAYRGRGLAAAAVGACVARAQAWGLERLALYGSRMGVPVYARMGFRTIGTLGERLSPWAEGAPLNPPSPHP